VRPGLTGWATVKVGYSNSIAAKRVALQYDLYHVENWTLAFDVKILARTAGHLIVRPEVRNRLMI
jgi:lipopolysaccharide/colanic/teichoic acid biosynthesis glycosyltransferase